ncbi:MAG: MoxR family ATPase [archaeon]
MAEKGLADRIKKHVKNVELVEKEVGKAVIGQHDVVRAFIRGILANGHVLVEGVPGIAKTLIVRSLSIAWGAEFKRIQFTPDLLPSDIMGISTYEESRGFYVLKGPIFGNFILADEINRAPPKVQSALLEGMQERQVTIGKETFELPYPFFVLATQNPLEQLGTFPLPEAQVDRFLFKLFITYPTMEEEQKVLETNMSTHKFDEFNLQPVLNDVAILEMQDDVKKIYLDPKIEKYIVTIVDATRNPAKYKIRLGRYISWGSSPRGSTSMFIAAKADAMMAGKDFVTPNNVKKVAHDVLRHRLILNYEGQSEEITTDEIIKEILQKVPVP